MTDELTLRRANRAAEELVETEKAFAEVEATMMEAWAASNITDVDYRERMFHGVRVLKMVRAALYQRVNSGKILKHAAETAALLAPNRAA